MRRTIGMTHLFFMAISGIAATLAAAPEAAATGMQGHIYMAQCAAEQAQDPRLRELFDARGLDLANGAFFPDSGYTAADHDQGEIAHWEQYVEGNLELIRERFPDPLSTPEGQQRVAFLMGIAAHGITDSTFDSLLFERSEQVDLYDHNPFDMAMDIFLVNDRPRYFVPEFSYDAGFQADVYNQKIMHPVEPKAITDAMETAWSGISVVAKFVYLEADNYGKKFPWARANILDGRTPGGYPFGAKAVLGYYRELLRRLDGSTSADNVVIGTYPDEERPLVTLDSTRPDGKIVFFFGEGMDRATIDDAVVEVKDDAGNVVPTTVSVYRGDKWANVLRVTAGAPWAPSTKYTATLRKSIKTLHGVSPTNDVVLSFATCTPDTPGGDCAEKTGAAPPSPCPKLDAMYAMRPTDMPEEEEPPPPAVNPVNNDSGGCGVALGEGNGGGAILALGVALAGLSARRRAGRSERKT